uniref:transmembrane protein 116 isoform X2 n=1 Tax=Myxine glutinosa TaxID=7769 RepID=UPI00358F90EE
MAETRSSSTVWLLRKSEKEIICGGLPTKGHTLQKMVYHHIQEHHTVRESAKLSVQAVWAYWEKSRIPVQRVDSCERQLLKLYEPYKLGKKNRTKTFENYRVKEQMFKDDLQSLFDISPNDALEKMTNEEDKAFLIMQREDPSCSRMGSVDNTLTVKENRKRIRVENEDKRKKKHAAETLTAMQSVPSTSAVVDDDDDDDDDDESEIESSDSGDNEFKLQSPSSAKQAKKAPIKTHHEKTFNRVTKAIFMIYFVCVTILCSYFYSIVRRSYNAALTQRTVLLGSSRERETTYTTLYFQLYFLFCWSPVMLLCILSYVPQITNSSIFVLHLLQAITMPLQGAMISLVYGWFRRSFRHLREMDVMFDSSHVEIYGSSLLASQNR